MNYRKMAVKVVPKQPKSPAYRDRYGRHVPLAKYYGCDFRTKGLTVWEPGEFELIKLRERRDRLIRRASEMLFVESCHPTTFRIMPERPSIKNEHGANLRADFGVYDETGKLVALYEFGALSQFNKFKFWAETFPEADIF